MGIKLSSWLKPYIRSEDLNNLGITRSAPPDWRSLPGPSSGGFRTRKGSERFVFHASLRSTICRQTLQLKMFGEMVGNAAGRRRGPRTRRLGSTMAQQLRIGNQWIRKQCLDLTGKISQSVRKVVEYLLSINRLSYLRSRRRRRCFTYHGTERNWSINRLCIATGNFRKSLLWVANWYLSEFCFRSGGFETGSWEAKNKEGS